MTQKNIFVCLFVALFSLTAFAETPPDMSCSKFPKTFNIRAIEYTMKEISGNYKVRIELRDLRTLPCLTMQDYIKQHDLFRFAKTKIPAGQSLGTIQYVNAETGRVTQTEEIDTLGVAFKAGKVTWIWGIEFDLNRYFNSTTGADNTGMAYDMPRGASEAPTTVPSQIILGN